MKSNPFFTLCALISLFSTAPLLAAPVDGGIHAEGPATVNDNFANRSVIPAAGGIFTGNNNNANHESGEPNPTGSGDGHSIWWSWTPTTSGTVTI